jgi:HEAT repeat protein
MTENQKTGFLIGGICLLAIAVIAAPSIYSSFHHRSLLLQLDDPNPAVRVAAIRATEHEGHVDMLMKALQDEDADVRLVAAMHLQRRRAEAAPSIKALIAALKDEHAGVRHEAAVALSAIGAPAAPALVEALTDPDPRVRSGAIVGLGDVARPKDWRKRPPEERALVIPAMEKLLEDDDPEVRQKAAAFLEYFGRSTTKDEPPWR